MIAVKCTFRYLAWMGSECLMALSIIEKGVFSTDGRYRTYLYDGFHMITIDTRRAGVRYRAGLRYYDLCTNISLFSNTGPFIPTYLWRGIISESIYIR